MGDLIFVLLIGVYLGHWLTVCEYTLIIESLLIQKRNKGSRCRVSPYNPQWRGPIGSRQIVKISVPIYT